jgi:tetratricopeptide (TPR) repeat protein
MTYVGNTALSPQIQERIQSTFAQTLSLAEEGNRQEALLGCDFILRLDPLFEPARTLQERLSQGEGPVDVSNLTEETPAETESSAAPEVPLKIVESETESPVDEAPFEISDTLVEPPPPNTLVDINELIADESIIEPAVELAPTVEDVDFDITEPALSEAPAEVAAAVDDLPGRMAMLFEQRSFQDLMTLAVENQERVSTDADLRQLIDTASERLEAEPYVRNFLDSARSARESGDLDSARSHLDKARELDPTHPDLTMIEADLQAASMVAPPAAFEPPPPIQPPPLVETPPLAGPEPLEAPVAEVEELFEPVDQPTLEDAVEAPADEAPPAEMLPPIPSLDAEPAARLDNESEQRIDELLQEGQESFEDGQYQTAIDAWSRIFLIDIDHAEASRRIELARKLKAEVERQIEEAFHEAISLLEAGDEEDARKAFDKVLEIQPNHMGARDYLEKLSSGELATPGATPTPDLTPLVDEPAGEAAAGEAQLVDDLAPPSQGPKAVVGDLAPEDIEPALKPAASRGRSFVAIGAAVLILVLAIGWFVYSKWDRFFPGSTPTDEAAATEARIDPIERARELHEAGSSAMAINVLRRVAPGHEQYAEALALIAMWEAGDQEAEVESAGPSEEALAHREDLVELAHGAVADGENILALTYLQEASKISALSEEELMLETRATSLLEPLREELDMFENGDWEYSLPALWRMYDSDGSNKDVIRLMVDSYYNLGLRDLQRGDTKAALEKFKEAQDLTADDPDLDRLTEFASAYVERPADMLYRIFVKYQKFR